MENILSRLRKTTPKTKCKKEESVDDKKNNSTEENQETSHFDDELLPSSTIVDIPSTLDTNTQTITPFTIMKLDFNILRKYTREINISEILKAQEFKIEKLAVVMVKKIEKFTSEICQLELIDESGTIGCSCMYTLVSDLDINIGNILKIKNFSLWKISTNHVNLVKSNIVEKIEN